jgi:hypothetical protein
MRQAVRACNTTACRTFCLPSSRAVLAGNRRYNSTQPFKGFEIDTLDAPLHSLTPRTRTTPVPPPPDELPATEDEEKLAKARVVFGSRLAGPKEREKAKEEAGRHIAGILVPPKPEEPDNCCMSGCVNCVWDLFRDDMEEWAMKSAQARSKLEEQRKKDGMTEGSMPKNIADNAGEDTGGDLFEGIPVGIREFMKTEKMLKLRHQQEAASGG